MLYLILLGIQLLNLLMVEHAGLAELLVEIGDGLAECTAVNDVP